ncbi:MAG: hypothetical protein DRJ97_03220 [Thermoprotei archaeon]|nr:MAG: hypothetical protein DRJ97_03220 [Thermoprotei archaeon]
MTEDAFEKLLERYRRAIEERGGEARFEDIVEWAQREDLGSALVATVILNEMVKRGVVEAPQGFKEVEGLEGLTAPVVVKLKEAEKPAKPVETKPRKVEEAVPDKDLELAISYLNDYWSVGELRLIDDLKLMGVSEPQKVVRKLVELGYVERSPSGVINATEKLPKVKRGVSLALFT